MTDTVGFDLPNKPCNRTLGRSCRDCWCRLPGGGWLPCPDEAQGVLVPLHYVPIGGALAAIDVAVVEPRLLANVATIESRELANAAVRNRDKVAEARSRGYTGNFCTNCYGVHMRFTGTCEVCDDCGHSGACG